MKDLIDLTKLFKVNGNDLVLTPSQQQIFNLIATNEFPRNQVIAPTQYGKSLTVAVSVLIRSVAKGEKFIVLAPSEKKASIIMGYIIDHCFDSDLFTDQLELDQSTSLDRLKRERSRTHLTFKSGGGVMILSLDARNGKRSIEAAMGFGGNRIILDEASLIDDALYATVKRMLGGYAYKDTFLLEIGNPFYRNHFYRTWNTERYNKLFIDYNIGLAEERYSEEFIEEMRDEAFFSVFYECKFPDEDAVDEFGYRQLITTEEIMDKYIDTLHATHEPMKLGVDIGGGGDYNTFVIRQGNQTWIETRNRSNDTMTNVNEVIRIISDYTVPINKGTHVEKKRLLIPQEVFLDDIGIGRGVTDRLIEMGYAVNGISVGGKAKESDKYTNIKAENFWHAAQWIKQSKNKILRDDKWQQMTWIKYKVSTDKVLKIEPKEELKRRTSKSPDFAEAFMLTFSTPPPEPNIRLL